MSGILGSIGKKACVGCISTEDVKDGAELLTRLSYVMSWRLCCIDQDHSVPCLSSSEDTSFVQLDMHRACCSLFQDRWSSEMGNTHSCFSDSSCSPFPYILVCVCYFSSLCLMKVVWISCSHVSVHIPYSWLLWSCEAVSPGGVFLWALTYFTKQRNPSGETGGRGNAASKELCAIHQGRLLFYTVGYFPAMHFNLGFGLSA